MITITNYKWENRTIEESDLDQYPGWLIVDGMDAGLSDAEIEDMARRYDAFHHYLFLSHRPQGDPHEWFLRAREIWPCHFFGSFSDRDYPRGDCKCEVPRGGKYLDVCLDCGGILIDQVR